MGVSGAGGFGVCFFGWEIWIEFGNCCEKFASIVFP